MLFEVSSACADQASSAASDAIQTACKLEDWPAAANLPASFRALPGLVESQPDLAMLIGQVAARADFSTANCAASLSRPRRR